jgi:hypothetical protein
LRGLILDALGRTSEALMAYQEAVRLNPKLDDAIVNLRDAELEQNDLQKSIKKRRDTWLIIFFGITGLFFILLSTSCLYFTFLYGSKLFGPKTTLIFEPDYSLISTVSPADLEATAQILTERSESLGYTGISFVVSENNQIIGQIPNSIDIQNFTDRLIAIGLLEFVDFGKTSLPDGTFVATDFDYQYLSQPNGTRWHTLMTNNELEAINVAKNQIGNYDINFTLTSKGTKIFLDYTTENVGSYLGIVMDKHIISAPMVNAPITAGSATITGVFTEETAENLATYLKIRGPLPIPLKVRQPLDNDGGIQ